MEFLDRVAERARLDGLFAAPEGGLAVVFGRRRIGKTRLLVEWCRARGGLYAVADQSAAPVQRRQLAEAVGALFPGFAGVEYPSWRALLERLAQEARQRAWRGPLVLDELPYWVGSSPELPSVLQRWVDHEAKAAGLVVAVAGSSQRMMQGLTLGAEAPLYGRAQALFEVPPLPLGEARRLPGLASARALLEFHAAWGGVPRYWELHASTGLGVGAALDALVLDPQGPLHREPDRLLLEEVPSALEVRPLLDVLGGGAHRVSEMAARLGRPATSLARPLERLRELGLARREVPFGESPRDTKRSLHRVADPFTRLWFRVVAPHRAELTLGTRAARTALLARHWPGLVATAWEELCRDLLPQLAHPALGPVGTWQPGARWWQGREHEWDVIAEASAGGELLVGEVKATRASAAAVGAEARRLAARPLPPLPTRFAGHRVRRALFYPEAEGTEQHGVAVVGLDQLVSAAPAGRRRRGRRG